MLAWLNSMIVTVVVFPHRWPAITPRAIGALLFLRSLRRFIMGDKSPKNVSKQKKVQDTKKQNAKKQPAVSKK